MFGTLGGPELFLIFVVALIIFGPRKLPEIGKSLGRMMAEFRKASNEFRSTIESEVEAEKIRDAMRIEPPKYEAPKAQADPAPAKSGDQPGAAESTAEAGAARAPDTTLQSPEPSPYDQPITESAPATEGASAAAGESKPIEP